MLAHPRLDRSPVTERGITIGDFLVPIRVGDRLSTRTRHTALVIVGAAFIALTANLSIRLGNDPVPITGQTFAVLLVGGALGFRRGILATLLYVLLGLALPIYADHRSGIAVIGAVVDGGLVLGPTGGYLIGFVLAGAIVGRLAELGWDRHVGGAVGMMLVGELAIYLVGLPWLMASTHQSVSWTISNGLTPFILGDAIKVALAAGLFPAAWWTVGRRPPER